MRNKLILLIAYFLSNITLILAQNPSSVTGIVISEEDGEPIIGATIQIKGTSIGVITDYEGKFTLQNVPSSARTALVILL